ncbi:MAG: polysaccharide deacetylase family protein [Clostridia bacterium]|nr:polysaccharide deacetylase family protein [Clostridia bacterium]
MIKFGLYPGGKPYALTMSYDDGRIYDRDLVSIFDRFGVRGSFHLNSGKFDTPGYITSGEVGTLYKNHEVSCHTAHHPFLERLPRAEVLREIGSDKARLEELSGGIVRGMSYPYGTFSSEVIEALRVSGMEYSRTTRATMGFARPADFMLWDPSCHHRDALALLDRFEETLKTRAYAMAGSLFYVWGHSYEFNDNGNWDLIETFCRRIGGRPDFWYATNIEIVDYLEAQKALRFSSDLSRVFNPSALSVWILKDDEEIRIDPGETRAL